MLDIVYKGTEKYKHENCLVCVCLFIEFFCLLIKFEVRFLMDKKLVFLRNIDTEVLIAWNVYQSTIKK